MIYENNGVRIVPFERDKHMTEEYRSWFHDPIVTQHNSHGLFPYTKAAMDAFVKDIEQGSSSRIIWAIELINPIWERRKKGEAYPKGKWTHVGNCSLQGINWINRSTELAIVIGEAEARGHGVGKQVCKWLIQHAFDKLNLNRVWTGTAATNIAMQNTAIACGMRQEGTFENGIFLNGRYEDVIAYSILKGQQLA